MATLTILDFHSLCQLEFHLEWFSFECQKVIGFAFATLHDWRKFSLQFYIQSSVIPKPIVTHSHAFSRALRQLPVIKFEVFIGSLYCVYSL